MVERSHQKNGVEAGGFGVKRAGISLLDLNAERAQ